MNLDDNKDGGGAPPRRTADLPHTSEAQVVRLVIVLDNARAGEVVLLREYIGEGGSYHEFFALAHRDLSLNELVQVSE